jgi:hypothetical protein
MDNNVLLPACDAYNCATCSMCYVRNCEKVVCCQLCTEECKQCPKEQKGDA